MTRDKVREESRQFGYVGCVFFVLIATPFFWKGRAARGYVCTGISVFFIVFTFVSPRLMKIVYRGWMAVVGVIGWVNRQILLSLVFFLLFTPTALVLRLIGRDYMNRKFDPSAESYWMPREGGPPDRSRYEQRF